MCQRSIVIEEKDEATKDDKGKGRSVESATLPPIILFRLGCAAGCLRRIQDGRIHEYSTGISEEEATNAPDPDVLNLAEFQPIRPVLLVCHAPSISCKCLVRPQCESASVTTVVVTTKWFVKVLIHTCLPRLPSPSYDELGTPWGERKNWWSHQD